MGIYRIDPRHDEVQSVSIAKVSHRSDIEKKLSVEIIFFTKETRSEMRMSRPSVSDRVCLARLEIYHGNIDMKTIGLRFVISGNGVVSLKISHWLEVGDKYVATPAQIWQ